MAVFVVTWNLNKERSNYGEARRAFIENPEKFDNIADPGLESVRWVSSTSNAQAVSDFLRTKLDKNDRLFVTKLHSGHHAGWLIQPVWDWINARL